MKMDGIGIGAGAAYSATPESSRTEKESGENYESAADKKVLVKRPPAATVGNVSVVDVFNRMTANGSGVNRAMARLKGAGVTVWADQKKDAMEGVWQEYYQQLPEEERDRAIDRTETESEIIVKPDGTRVLVITTKTNGIVTSVMTMKISEPTHEDNESGNEGASEMALEGEEMAKDGEGTESGLGEIVSEGD